MEARYYRDLIVRAVLGPDPVVGVADEATLGAIAEQMREAEEGLSILRARGRLRPARHGDCGHRQGSAAQVAQQFQNRGNHMSDIDSYQHMAAQAETQQAAAADDILASAQIRFFDKGNGVMAIEALHSDEFNPAFQSHACLRAVVQFLPEVCRPAGTLVEGETGTRMPITDGERYAAIRALAFLPDDERDALLDALGDEPATPEAFDAYADKLVTLGRTNPKPQEVKPVQAIAPKLVTADGKVLQ